MSQDITQMTRCGAVAHAKATIQDAISNGHVTASDLERHIFHGHATADGSTCRMRVIDAALQSLRRRGLIMFVKGSGWINV